jgi:predicted enzyme related to lactoylglutathione lyase
MANRQLNAKLVMCNVPSSNSAAARSFYNALFGGEDFARSLNTQVESYFRPISQDGLTLTIAGRQNDRETITCYFAVDNLAATLSQLQAAGGQVVLNPTPMAITAPADAKKVYDDAVKGRGDQPSDNAGQFATMIDPDGNYIGLIQLQGPLQHQLNAGQAQRQLTQQQANDHENWKQNGAPLVK